MEPESEDMAATRTGPLVGVLVIEMAGIGPAPFAATLLAELGAHVIRVERPTTLRSVIPTAASRAREGKEILQLDLKVPSSVERLLTLVERSDVLIEGHRPGVMERLGISPAVCFARNPRLVFGRMTGWGQTGPLAQRAGHDVNYIGVTGALHAIGQADTKPQIPLNLVGDYGGGALYLVVGVLAALHEARNEGHGQVVDAAIVDGVAHMLSGVHAALAAGLWTDDRGVNFMDGSSPFYAVYETSDGRYVSVSAVEPAFFKIFAHILGLDDEISEQQNRSNWPALAHKIACEFATRTQIEWVEAFEGTDACVAPVLSLREAAHHPQISSRGTIAETTNGLRAGPAPRFQRWPDHGPGP